VGGGRKKGMGGDLGMNIALLTLQKPAGKMSCSDTTTSFTGGLEQLAGIDSRM
jgi:hypothetical protein